MAKHKSLSLRPHFASAATSTSSTPYSSAYPSDVEDLTSSISSLRQTARRQPFKPFRFLDLPSELRSKIYDHIFLPVPTVLDLDPTTFHLLHSHKLLALFRVNKQLYEEATHHFFSTHTLQIFPTHPGKQFKSKRPLLARLPSLYREHITTLQLRVGPGWNAPPRGWVINDQLGLSDCTSVRTLKIFVECDPSDAMFAGYRREGFYEAFCQDLLQGILEDVGSIVTVEFDAWSSVKRDGDMVQGLRGVVVDVGKKIAWGPERGWREEIDCDAERVWLDGVLINGIGRTKVIASGCVS